MVTMHDVASKAGVSRATVSRVFSAPNSVKDDTKRKVLYWIHQLGYEPNKVAQALAGNSSGVIGVIVPNLLNPYYSEIVNYAEEIASDKGYAIIICCSNNQLEKEKRIFINLKARNVDGVLIFPASTEEKNYTILDAPFVTLGKILKNKSAVVSDLESGAKKIARHFIKNGYHQIGYIGPTSSAAGFNKYVAFIDYLKEQGIELTDLIVIPSKQESLQEVLRKYFAQNSMGSNAWFAHNDEAAAHLINYFSKKGLKVPDEIIVAGYDDTILAKNFLPGITSVYQPISEMVTKAFDLLLEEINTFETRAEIIKFDNNLVVRTSTLQQKLINLPIA